jgi:hypothetical protein
MYTTTQVGPTIFKLENILSKEECQVLFDYSLSQTNNPVENLQDVPWTMAKSNTLYYRVTTDATVRAIIKKYVWTMVDEIKNLYNEVVYPHITTLVLWKPGQSMPRHVDNGVGHDPQQRENLHMRKYTSVAYVNDNFVGGYTYIRNDGKDQPDFRSDRNLSFPNDVFEDYMSKPQQGTSIIFLGDDTNAHGVSRLESGDRVILSTWFTTDPRYIELDEIYYHEIPEDSR